MYLLETFVRNSESGLASSARSSEELLSPQTPPPGVAPHKSVLSSKTSPQLPTHSPPLCTSPPVKELQPSRDSIARFKP